MVVVDGSGDGLSGSSVWQLILVADFFLVAALYDSFRW